MNYTFHINSLGESDPEVRNQQQQALYEEWEKLADLGTALFRFYGRIDELGLPHLDLQMEFAAPVGDPLWKKMYEFCRAYGWQYEMMFEGDETNEEDCQVEIFCNVHGWRKEIVADRIRQTRELLMNQPELWAALVEVE